MIYLLDTNICVRYLRGTDRQQLEARLNATSFGDVALCSVVKAELLYGAAIALASGLVLVTHNTTEFSRVAALQIEDWQVS